VAYDAGARVFLISKDGAAFEAGGLNAMMTGGRDRLLEGVLFRASVEEPDTAPGFVFVEAVQLVAGGDTGFAARTSVQVNRKGILLAPAGKSAREQFAVESGMGRERVALVVQGEPFDRSEPMLFLQQLVDERVGVFEAGFAHSSLVKMA
jgi:hypothetical protein